MRRFSVAAIVSSLFWVCSSVLIFASPVAAFSGYGVGTSLNPYRISSCAQLGEINSNLGGYYVLVSNIDCTGGTFTHLADGSSFTGTLDGQDHTIANLSIDNYGLIRQSDSGAVIENLNISSGSVSGSTYIGSFVGHATDTAFTNIHSAMTVTSTGAYSGGLVGSLSGTTTISGSSFTGAFSGHSYSGGLAGAMWDAGTSISDSFVSGTVSDHTAYDGAAVGGFFNGTLNRIYSSATQNLNGNVYNGGLVGDDQGTVNNSFSATTLVGTNTLDGGLIGADFSGTYNNMYFDKTTTATANCFGSGGSGTCTGVNTANATPNYFKNNSSNGPFSTWDFTNVWATTVSYPTLRNLSGFVAATVPNGGDANGDGTADSYQANVASIEGTDNTWATVTVPSLSGCTLGSPQSLATNGLKLDSGFTPQVNLSEFNIYCPGVGLTVPVTIIYDKLYDTGKSMLRYYNPTSGAYSTIPGAAFGSTTVGGVAKTTVTYNITDGGAFDIDGSANGVIEDPVGIATVAVTAPNTGFGAPDSNGALPLAIATLPLAMLVLGYSWRRYSKHSYQR